MIAELTKDPQATLDYGFDWSQWLGDDVITSSQWVVSSLYTVMSHSYSGTATIIWLSGGRSGSPGVITNRITTSDGRVEERSMIIRGEHR